MHCNIINKFKFISFLSIVLSMSLISPTYAADELSISRPGKVSTSYGAEIPSNFQLAIPKKITLAKSVDGEHYSADYNVIMRKCDLQPTQKVKVSSSTMFDITETSSSVTMPATNDMDISKDGNDGEVFFAGKLTDSATSGHIETDKLSAGNWNANVTFNINLEGGEVTLTSSNLSEFGIPTEGDVVIPEFVTSNKDGKSYKIVGIGYAAFAGCTNLALIELPSGITSIGYGAFNKCTNLALAELPSGITSIGDGAFNKCKNLALIELPSGITSIGEAAFNGCTNLALTELPSGITSIGDGAFNGCTNLALTELPSGITSIGEAAFDGCANLALTELPSGVTSIGYGAFWNCAGIESLKIPDTVAEIGDYAFGNVKHIEYHGSATGAPWGAKSIN